MNHQVGILILPALNWTIKEPTLLSRALICSRFPLFMILFFSRSKALTWRVMKGWSRLVIVTMHSGYILLNIAKKELKMVGTLLGVLTIHNIGLVCRKQRGQHSSVSA